MFFTGTFGLNFQMTSALMATEVFDKGATAVRPARHVHGRRVADRLAARRQPGAGPAPPGGRRALTFGAVEIAAGLMPTYLTYALVTPLLGLTRSP